MGWEGNGTWSWQGKRKTSIVKIQTSKNKIQTNFKSQSSIFKQIFSDQMAFGKLEIGYWVLFVICILSFGIFLNKKNRIS